MATPPTLLSSPGLVAALVLLAAPACVTTKYHQRERVADRAMQLDADVGVTYIRAKMEAAREGGFGGFGGSTAGNCGCQ